MKVFNLIIILLIFLSCNDVDNDRYPDIVKKYNKRHQYDIAKLELYKINSFYNCECDAVIRLDSSGILYTDTVSFWDLEMDLDTLYFTSDTVTYNVKYYFSKINNSASILPGNNYYFCQNYYGIDFVKNSNDPIRYKIAESGYLNRVASSMPKDSIDSKFYKCLFMHRKKINHWLYSYLKKSGYTHTVQ